MAANPQVARARAVYANSAGAPRVDPCEVTSVIQTTDLAGADVGGA